MATQTFMDTEKKRLIKKYHTLAGRAGMDERAKDALLSGYGVESSRDLEVDQLIELCNTLNNMLNKDADKLDKLRKRLIAAVGGYLTAMGKQSNLQIILGTIRRASEGRELNELKEAQLTSLYGAFNKAQKDMKKVREMTERDCEVRTILN